ncbi:hypothetical protein WJX74_009418 [Apatococcus lobatus]|uniref:Uncharacterized protein n=1 Tax=Apatococcus lobatus TaxID=904363 RepID=A0AAW1QH41_9CHLO
MMHADCLSSPRFLSGLSQRGAAAPASSVKRRCISTGSTQSPSGSLPNKQIDMGNGDDSIKRAIGAMAQHQKADDAERAESARSLAYTIVTYAESARRPKAVMLDSAAQMLAFHMKELHAEALVDIVVAFAEMGYSPGLMFLQLLVRELDARNPANLAVGMASFARLEHHPGALLASSFAQQLLRQLHDPHADIAASLRAFDGISSENAIIQVLAQALLVKLTQTSGGELASGPPVQRGCGANNPLLQALINKLIPRSRLDAISQVPAFRVHGLSFLAQLGCTPSSSQMKAVVNALATNSTQYCSVPMRMQAVWALELLDYQPGLEALRSAFAACPPPDLSSFCDLQQSAGKTPLMEWLVASSASRRWSMLDETNGIFTIAQDLRCKDGRSASGPKPGGGQAPGQLRPSHAYDCQALQRSMQAYHICLLFGSDYHDQPIYF